MAMLNFKKGVYSALPTTISEGTIYVTTDEKAMYVDISATERIRLGQICVVDTIEAWENLKPPFSQEAFYYVVENNALLRNNGTASDPKWTQLNSVSDITTDLTSLTQRMDAAESNIQAANTAAATAQAAAEAAQKTADTGVANAKTAQDTADAAQKRADDAYALAEEAKGIAEQGVADAATAKSAADAAGTAAASAQTTADEAKAAAASAQTTADGAQAAAEKAQSTADGAQSAAEGAQAAAEAAQTKADDAHALANSANTLATTANTNAGLAQEAANANKELIEAQDERLQAVEAAVGTGGDGTSLADRIGALEDTVNDTTSGVAKNYERLNAIDTKFESYSTTEETNAAVDAKLANYSTTEAMNNAIDTKLADYSTTEETNEAISSAVNGLKTEVDTKFESYSTTEQMNDAINGALENYSTTDEVNSTINTKLADYSTTEEMNTAINAAKTEVQSEFNTKLESYSDTEEMNAAIASAVSSAIAENDAMTYKGVTTVDDDGNDDLPTVADGIKIGDTYKVGRDGYYDGTLCYVGDLLIANVAEGYEEDENGLIPEGGLIWDHIESGYEDTKEPTLSGDNGNIYLTSAVAADANKGDLGKISVMSMNENLKVAVSANAITMSLEWGSFEAETTE